MGNALIYQDYEDPPGPGKGMEFFKGLKMKTVELFFKQMRECETDLKLDVVERKVSFLTWRNYSRIVAEVREVIETDADHYKRTIWNPATMGYVMRNGLLPPLWEPEAPPTVKTDRYGNIIPDDFTDDDASDTEEDTDDEAEKSGSDEDGEGEDENGNKKLRPAKSSTEEGEGASEKKAANGSDSNEEDENDGDGSAGGSGEGEKKRTKVIKKNSGRPKRYTRWVG